ncbi:MAG TPA: alpha/beta hydrolase, partial [Prevotella sp.]|nr:alpha/beta hydrolase [Candidatus Segatella violae]
YASSLPWVSEIALGGHSQGGVVSAMTSGQLAAKPEQDIKPISAVVLLAPAAVLRDDALRGNTFGKMYDPKNPPAKIEMWGGKCLGGNYIRTAVCLPIYETAKNYQGPECILHGDADRVVPYTYGQRFHYLNKQSEWHLMTDADHGFGNQEEKSAHIASEFLAKVLK